MNIRIEHARRTPIEFRLAGYAALAAAAMAAPEAARAAIVYSGPVNINIPSNTGGLYLNVVSGQMGATSAAVPGWDVNPWNSTTLNFFTPTPNPGGGEMMGSGTNYINLPLDALIGPGSSFANAGTTTISDSTPLNFNSAWNFVGFRFINEAAGGQVQYGWLQIALSGTAASQPRAIVGYAYENTGTLLSLPLDIPEPAATTLLALAATGAIGLRVWRKRRPGRNFSRE